MMQVEISKDLVGCRLDKFLCQKFDISFGLAQKLIREKKVKVNSFKCDCAYKIADLDQIEIFAELKKRIIAQKPRPKISLKKITEFRSLIVFEDNNMLAINKPSGLAVQGGSGIEISVDDFLPHLSSATKQENFQLVHRLDKDTSGILLIAKNRKSADLLSNAFKNKKIRKTYLALVFGIVRKNAGVINIPLRKRNIGKNQKILPDFEEGKEAITEYQLIKNFEDYSLLELRPITGRTHQLRVHCKEIGHPILNDVKYGGREVLRKNLCSRLCLHAQKIELENFFGRNVVIEAIIPEFIKNYS